MKVDRHAARKMRRSGASLREIADRFGVSVASASIACKGVACPIDHQRAAVAKHAAARRSCRTVVVRRVAVEVKPGPSAVPAWVRNAGLAEDFRDFRRDFDIYHAARECRRLKAEADRPCL